MIDPGWCSSRAGVDMNQYGNHCAAADTSSSGRDKWLFGDDFHYKYFSTDRTNNGHVWIGATLTTMCLSVNAEWLSGNIMSMSDTV